MLISLYAILPVFMLIAGGYLGKKFKIVDEVLLAGLEHLCFYFLFPALIIYTFAKADFKSLELSHFMLAILLNLGLFIVLGLIIRPFTKKHGLGGPQYSSLFQGVTRWHGFIALTIAGNLYGADGLVYLTIIMATYTPILNVVNVIVIGISTNSQSSSYKQLALKVVKNPIIIACLLGNMLNITPMELPAIAGNTLFLLGRGAMGLGLISLGGALVINHIHSSYRLISYSIIIKLLLMPLSMYVICIWLDVGGVALSVAIIAAAVPTAAGGFVLARKMGGDALLMANIITAQLCVSLFTMPLILNYSATNHPL